MIFGLSAEEALDEFINLCVRVLDKQGVDAQTRTLELKEYLENLLEKHNINKERRLLDQSNSSNGCKLSVFPSSIRATNN